MKNWHFSVQLFMWLSLYIGGKMESWIRAQTLYQEYRYIPVPYTVSGRYIDGPFNTFTQWVHRWPIQYFYLVGTQMAHLVLIPSGYIDGPFSTFTQWVHRWPIQYLYLVGTQMAHLTLLPGRIRFKEKIKILPSCLIEESYSLLFKEKKTDSLRIEE